MSFYLDIGYSQLNKKGEEVCGDSIEVLHAKDSTIIVLADGLSSGAKAGIISRITAKTAATMLKRGLHIDEVIEIMAEALPMDKVRNLAYSTFSILQVFNDGRAYLAEFDTPPVYLCRQGSLLHIERSKRKIGCKQISEAHFRLKEGDWMVLMSDGVLRAGIGEEWNTGWGERQVCSFIKGLADKDFDSMDIAEETTGKCNDLYNGNPGDDVSVVVVKFRKSRKLTALIGPPQKFIDDRKAVEKLMKAEGKKVVCGGSTSGLVSRILKKEETVNLESETDIVPPTGSINGIDLVTEGVITIHHALQLLKNGIKIKELEHARDGASLLAAELLKADKVHSIVGLAVNQAMHKPGFPEYCAAKSQTVRDIAETLIDRGKKVTIEYL